LKTVLTPEEHGVVVCGGKGKTSRKTPMDIQWAGDKWGFSQETIEELAYTSRITAKVDNSAIQAGYQLYHHAFVVTEDEKWAVIQQGLSDELHNARRYHWLSTNTSSFVDAPANAVACDIKRDKALNMVARESQAARKASVDLSKEPPKKLMNLIQSASRPKNQSSLQSWLAKSEDPWLQTQTCLNMPRNINWATLDRVYEFQPSNYEELLAVKGVGPATVRGLALVAELVYGEAPSWEDPVKFSYAYGGKDGVPFPVNRHAMDESIDVLRKAVEDAHIGETERIKSLSNLRQFLPTTLNS
jgi:hypothetical protein